MQGPCPDCRGEISRSDMSLPAPRDLNEFIAIDRGDIYGCSQCGKHFVIWNARNLLAKTLLAVFSAIFGLLMLGAGVFAVTVLAGIPELFGFAGRGAGEARGAFVATAVVGLAAAALAFHAYLPDVIRQWILRTRLSGRLEQ